MDRPHVIGALRLACVAGFILLAWCWWVYPWKTNEPRSFSAAGFGVICVVP